MRRPILASGVLPRALHARSVAAVILFALLSWWRPAVAQVQTFFVQSPEDEAAQLCASEFTATLVNYRTFRGQQEESIQRTVTECLGSIAGSSAQRECALSMANIDVDFFVRMRSNRLGDGWNWTLEALSPSQGSAQIWGGSDIAPDESDRSKAAYASCRYLAMKFACSQETNEGCADSQRFEAERRKLARAKLTAVAPTPNPNPTPGPDPAPRPPLPEPKVEPEPEPVPTIDPRIAGWILVSGLTPSNAVVAVDGTAVGTGSGEYAVVAGQRRVVISAPGYEEFQKSVRVSVGAIETVDNVSLKKVPSYLQTRDISPPGAIILVDGERVGTGAGRFEIGAGDHLVTIAERGYISVERKIRAVQGSTSMVEGVALARAATKLTVSVEPSDAQIKLDDEVVLTGSGTVKVAPGKHRLVVSAPGYDTYTDVVTCEEGVETTRSGIALRLTPATLTITSDEEDSEVWLDSSMIGTVKADTPTTFKVPTGTFFLNVGREGYSVDSRVVVLEAAERLAVDVELRALPSRVLSYSTAVGFGSSFLVDPYFDDARIAAANGLRCEGDNACDLSWDRDAVFEGSSRFEFRSSPQDQQSGPWYTSGSDAQFGFFIETRPDVMLTLKGNGYDSDTGTFDPFERQIPWSAVTVGAGVMTVRDGFGIDGGIFYGFEFSSFGKLSDEVGFIMAPRIELTVPVTDFLGLYAQYELSLGWRSVPADSDDYSDGAESYPDPTIAQRLGVGLEVGF